MQEARNTIAYHDDMEVDIPVIDHTAENCCHVEICRAPFGSWTYAEAAESLVRADAYASVRTGAGLPTGARATKMETAIITENSKSCLPFFDLKKRTA